MSDGEYFEHFVLTEMSVKSAGASAAVPWESVERNVRNRVISPGADGALVCRPVGRARQEWPLHARALARHLVSSTLKPPVKKP